MLDSYSNGYSNSRSRIQKIANNSEMKTSQNKGYATISESTVTNKTFTPKNDLDYEFSIVKMLARDVTILFRKNKVSVVFFIYFKCCNLRVVKGPLAPTYI